MPTHAGAVLVAVPRGPTTWGWRALAATPRAATTPTAAPAACARARRAGADRPDPRRRGRQPEPRGRQRRAARRSARRSTRRRPTLNLIAVGYSLGLAASVLYLGALGDRYGRKLMLILGIALSIPACLLAAYAPTDEVLFVARVLGGRRGGHGLPDHAGPDRRAVVRARPDQDDRAVVGASAAAIASLGPLSPASCSSTSGGARSSWSPCRSRPSRCCMASFFVPAHVNEATEPVDNLGGILSVLLVGALVLAINFAAVPNAGAAGRSASAPSPLAAGVAFVLRQRRAAEPALRPATSPARRIFWVAASPGSSCSAR